jgi:hypothetical protein
MSTKATTREATAADRIQIEALLDSFQLRSATTRAWGPSWWQWLWERNPALQPDKTDLPLGWVLESNGDIVGFFGNIPMRYSFGDRTLLASIASHWAVLQAFRSQTNELATAYFDQPNIDLLMVTTGIRATRRIFERHAATPMPLSNYQQVLYWVIDPEGFVAAALRKKKIQQGLAQFCGLVVDPFFKTAARLAAHQPKSFPPGIHLEIIGLDAINEEFDELWQRKSDNNSRLYAYRRAEDIRWHFECASRRSEIRVICCRRSGQLEGYAILLHEEVAEINLFRAKLVDLFTATDAPDLINALLAAAYDLSKARGCHLLEIVGLPIEIHSLARRFRPLSRLYPTFPFYYKATSSELHTALSSSASWYPTLYDGDSSLS